MIDKDLAFVWGCTLINDQFLYIALTMLLLSLCYIKAFFPFAAYSHRISMDGPHTRIPCYYKGRFLGNSSLLTVEINDTPGKIFTSQITTKSGYTNLMQILT